MHYLSYTCIYRQSPTVYIIAHINCNGIIIKQFEAETFIWALCATNILSGHFSQLLIKLYFLWHLIFNSFTLLRFLYSSEVLWVRLALWSWQCSWLCTPSPTLFSTSMKKPCLIQEMFSTNMNLLLAMAWLDWLSLVSNFQSPKILIGGQ